MLKKLGTRHWILLGIVILAAVLRFYNYSTVSLSNDELSALSRVHYDNLGDLIKYGVMVDGHPAGVQFLLFIWGKLFGITEASIRLPFVFAGILAVVISYLVASRWFGVSSGLMSATAMAFLEFPLLYSQNARPYIIGLLFSLLTAWFWTIILFGDRKGSLLEGKIPNWLQVLGLSLSAAACMYSHYFSALFTGIILVSGILFLENENLRKYSLSLLLAFLFFVPHFPVSLHQFTNVGDIGGWLPPPTPEWIPRHLFFIFNNSVFVVLLVFLFISLGFAKNFKQFRLRQFHLLALVWFATPFAIGYIFSIAKAPLLQNSVLIFSFPFLIFLCFSFFPAKPSKFTIIAILALASTLCYSTIVENKYYQVNHMGDMDQLVIKPMEWAEKYGQENITFTTNANSPYYVEYYLQKFDKDLDFKMRRLDKDTSLRILAGIVENSNTDYFSAGWSTKYHPPEIGQIIMEKYPYLVQYHKFNNTELFLYGRKPVNPLFNKELIYKDATDFTEWGDDWNINEGHFEDTDSIGKVYHMSDGVEYGPTLILKVKDMPQATELRIRMKVLAKQIDGQQIVVDVSHQGEGYQWTSMEFKHFLYPDKWGYVYMTVDLPEFKSIDDEIKVYPWNPSKKDTYIKDVRCRAY